MGGEQDQVQDEDQGARRVAEGPASGRDRVALLRRGDLRKVGVVHDHRDGHRRVGDDQQEAAEEIAVAVQEEQTRGGGRAHIGGERQEGLLAARAVGHRAGQGHDQDRHDDRRGDGVGEEGARPDRYPQGMNKAVGVRRRLRDRGQIGAQEHGEHARRVDGAGPVVEVPAALFAPPFAGLVGRL